MGKGNFGHFHFHECRQRTCITLFHILCYDVRHMNNSELIKQPHSASPCVEPPALQYVCSSSSRAARGRQGDASGKNTSSYDLAMVTI